MGFRALFRPLLPALLLASAPNLSAQLSSDSILAARRYSATHNGMALIVKERGQLRFEDYYNGYAKGTPVHIYSGTKSFFGVLAAIAQEEGLLSLDERVAETIPEWRNDPRKQSITIRELLNFSSGLETGFEKIYGRSSADKIALAVSLDATRDRGESFVYGPGSLNVFCEVLRRKLGSKRIGYEGYLRKKLIQPLGIDIARWREDDQGNVVPSAGIHTTAQDWMNFGEMINAGGTWQGRRLVKPESLAQCFRGTGINPSFGLGFWLNGYASRPDAREADPEEWLDREPMPEDWSGTCLSKNAPPDLVVSLGSTFQRLYLVPSMDLVVVHHGKRGHAFRDAEFLRILFDSAEVPTPTGTTAKPRTGLPKLFNAFRKDR
ncbi:MAG: serine hydrolase domain-containing protein [Verrucomicrobiales bacterium]